MSRSGLRAIILIGGEGTRLRPLTLDTPKPLLPVANRPFLSYQFEVLRTHGIKDVVLCTAYKPAAFKGAVGDGRRYGVRIRYLREKTPLGTGGAIKNAEALAGGTTVVFNGDILNDLDLTAFLRFHRSRRADATIALVPVEDPTQYGLVETAPDGRVRRFLEKPSPAEVTCDTINAGAYAFERDVFRRIPAGTKYSVERGLFPTMLGNGSKLYGFVRRGYWMDIGTVEKYLQANSDVLEGRTPFEPAGRRKGEVWREDGVRLDPYCRVEGWVALGRGAAVGSKAVLRGSVAIGARCRVEDGAVIQDSVLLEGARVGARARVVRSVLGRGTVVGRDAVVEGAALGRRAAVPAYSRVGKLP